MKANSKHSTIPARAAQSTLPIGAALAVLLVALTAVYFVWFAQQTPRRMAVLGLLGDPFSLVAEWFGPAGTPLGVLDRIFLVALAMLILLAAYGMGRLAIDRWRLAEGCSELELTLFALAGGLSLLSTATLLLGLAGGLGQAWLLWAIVIGFAASSGWKLVVSRRNRNAAEGVANSARQSASPPQSAIRIPQSAIGWLAVPFALILLLGACLPPWDFDVREYHLQVPKEWLQQGQVTFLPHNVYGNMPLAAEMHALLAMALWPGENGWFYGALAGKVVIAAFALITAAAVAVAAYRIAGTFGAMIATLVVISHPWLVHVSVNGLNDGVLACYVFLALYATWLARSGTCSYVLAGLFAGAAAATKYPGLAFAVLPVALWAATPLRGSFARQRLAAIALVLVGVFVGGGAWYAKNAALAGNPIYPLAYSVFGGATRTPEKAAQWNQAHQVPPDANGWRYAPRQLAGSIGKIAGRDDLASPLVPPLLAAAGLAAIAAFLASTPHSALRNPHSALPSALALAWILTVWWLFSHRLDRFLLPAWPIAALLSAGAMTLEDRWWRRAVTAMAAIGAAFCLLAASSQLVGDNRWFVSLEQLRRDGPWPEGTALRVKAGHQWLIDHAKHGETVLLVGDAEPFDLSMRAYYNTCFDNCLLCDWMLGKATDERQQELASRNIAWVLVDWPEIDRYRSPGNYGFDPRFDPLLIDELVEQGILGPAQSLAPVAPAHRRGVEIYPVRPTSSPAL